VEDDLLGGSHLSAVNEKEKKKKEGGSGCGLARRLLGWSFPGRPVAALSLFFCLKPFPFYFLVCFITFSFKLQMSSNQLLNFSRIQHNNANSKIPLLIPK
jgi:hypothetical protein